MHGPGIDMILADEAFDGTTGNFIDVYWTLADHQGSVTSVLSYTNGQTSVVQQLAYTAFGSIGSIRDGQGNAVTSGPLSRFAYTGREFDAETGNTYYRARYYDAQTGRFLSEDPIGFAAGDMNLYRYVGNSTPNWVDPTGLVAASTSGPKPTPPYPKPPTMTTDGFPGAISLIPPLVIGVDPLGPDSVDQGFWAAIRQRNFELAKTILERFKGFCPESRRAALESGLKDALRHIDDSWFKHFARKSLKEKRDWLKGFDRSIERHMRTRGGCDTTETIRMKIMRELVKEMLPK